MRCLYCYREINGNASDLEREQHWHSRCVKKFFGTVALPALELDDEALKAAAELNVNNGYTVTGVQKKLSLHLSKGVDNRLTIVNYPSGYILKPQTEEYELLPEYEELAMRIADIAGVQTVPHALIESNGTYSYITKRVDREGEALYAMEDFCQITERLTSEKYKSSYEKCSAVIRDYSSRMGVDMTEMFLRIVVSYIVGNSDMHLKNLSLIETAPASREFVLSKAYDILPVNIVLPEDNDEMALTLNGKRRRLKRRDFLEFASRCGIPDKVAASLIRRTCSRKDRFHEACKQSCLPEKSAEEMIQFIDARIEVLLKEAVK